MTILDKYIFVKFANIYFLFLVVLLFVSMAVHFANTADSALADILPLFSIPAAIASVIAFSETAEHRELEALYAAGISLFRVARGALLCCIGVPLALLLFAAILHQSDHLMFPAILSAGASAAAVSWGAIAGAEFARREPGIAWLGAGVLLSSYWFISSRYTALGEHPIFETWCAVVQGAAFTWTLWFVYRHYRQWL